MVIHNEVLKVNTLLQNSKVNIHYGMPPPALFGVLHYELEMLRASLLMPGVNARVASIRDQLRQLAADCCSAATELESIAAAGRAITVSGAE